MISWKLYHGNYKGVKKYTLFQNHFQEKCRQCGPIIMFEEDTPTFIEGF